MAQRFIVNAEFDQLEGWTSAAAAETPRPALAGLGVDVEHLRVRSPRPAEAVIQIATERRAGLLVFGPDPSRFKPRFFSRVVRRIRKRASCLLWIAGEGP